MNDITTDGSIAKDVAERRTFAIISHPDAGKTTLTEKLLLYSGMIRTAGAVRARKGGKATSSDWMALEQERGISISASAMQFKYKDTVINLLDTPGHQDFSEDTYRTLTATDSAVMVIDAGKGVEAQTRKLFAVCSMRKIPILTFMNKMDLDTRDHFELLHEVEEVLGIKAAPLNWPIGSGKRFAGVVDCVTHEVLLFSRRAGGGAERADIKRMSWDEFEKSNAVEEDILAQLKFDIELIREAGNPFSKEEFLAGKITPVFFGAALTNFGIEPFFDRFVELAPAPRPMPATTKKGEDTFVDPVTTPFSAFVFKIQANMNPRHRDCMAYLRVASGRFERDMTVQHVRTKKEVRLSRSYSLVAQDRSTIDEGFAGDIIGVINPGLFSIGDTVALNDDFEFKPMPAFPPEVVAQVRPLDVMRRKAFEKGMAQLCAEGTVQLLRSYESPESPPYVAAVGQLQFEVLQYRLKDEYGVETQLDVMPYRYSAWLEGEVAALKKPRNSMIALDTRGRVVMLFASEWEKNYLLELNPEHKLRDFVS